MEVPSLFLVISEGIIYDTNWNLGEKKIKLLNYMGVKGI